MDTDDRTWRVGELAQATGLSVRTLHHYDEIGLLAPRGRTASGHRQYDAADVRRLHRVLALRAFGLPLAEVAQVLDGDVSDVRELIRTQLEVVEEQVAAATKVQRKLVGVLTGLEQAEQPSAQTLIELIEVMTAMTRALTRQEFEALAESRKTAAAQLSPEELAAMTERRQKAAADLTPEQLEEMTSARAALMPEE
ncbi:MerR family transcriptional regulator [Kribbella sp. NPDC056951]|uniref:MerR family transcriptional regulator n=1 Tax=Kribbella sp. NPDC056951 TaxID=3345978 RepID=UPI0036289301